MDRREQVLKYLERLGPYFGGVITVVTSIIWHADLIYGFSLTGMDGKEAIDAVFDVMVTLTAFLFSVFVLAIAPGGGFIEKIFGTTTFRIFKRYVAEALILGAAAAVASIPFMTTEAGQGVWNGTVLESLYYGLIVCASLGFFRVVHIFIHWLGYDAAHRKAHRA